MAVILVVEDDQATGSAISNELRNAGHEVQVAATGVEAFAHIAERLFDAITLDRMLPDTDGLAVVAGLRERGVTAPVGAVSLMRTGLLTMHSGL